MPSILRIDVDKPFLRKKSLTKRTCLFHSRGYLESCKDVIENLNGRGLKESISFQPFTVPNKEFAEELVPRYPRKYLAMVENIYREIN